MSFPSRHVFLTEFTGRLTLPLAESLTSFADDRLARNDATYVGFHDWEAMLHYDAEARGHLMRWTMGVRGRIRALHFLVASKLVHMGVTVGNLTLGMSLQSYTTRDRFDAALRQALVDAEV